MKRTIIVGLLVALTACFIVAVQRTASAGSPTDSITAVDPGASAKPLAKKCSFDSDCPAGKCGGGQCGSCGFDSDCKGYGKCSGGQCGSCGFDSDCKGYGSCSGGHCTKAPW